ncbi:MAG TPA: iron ABC transporter permease [Spirochaetales bacterium]|nr:iron ABC transporter permease [Spirochaetales bacterium]HRY54938.1 iron ABC transporter permease [Spirochaetia bacterium]HRZ65284.1 iron ABC transporter permease [Spirochaetia bacterium]
MFTPRKLLIFGLVSALVLAFVSWMFVSISDTFHGYIRSSQTKHIASLAESIPGDPEAFSAWKERVSATDKGLKILYLAGDPQGNPVLASTGPEDEELLAQLSASADYAAAMESVAYQEKFFSKTSYLVGGRRIYPVYVPLMDADSNVTGTAVFMGDENEARSFDKLLLAFALILAFAVLAVLGAALFSREPIVGYAILVLFVIVGAFVVYPLYEAFKLSVMQEGRIGLDLWRKILAQPKIWTALRNSCLLGLVTASVSTLIGYVFAFYTTRTAISPRRRRVIKALATLPIISPPFSLTLSLILLFGNNGFITKKLLGIGSGPIYGLGGLVAIQTLTMFTIAFSSIEGVLQAIDATTEEASMDLRAGKLKTFLKVTLPLSLPGILSAWLLVFTTAIADFANPLLLAGGFKVLSVEAYLEVVGMSRVDHGTVYALVLLLPTIVAFLVQRYWITRRSYVTVTGKPSTRLYDLTSPPVKAALAGFIVLFLGFIVGMYLTIVAGCFVRNWGIDYSFTLENFGEAFRRGGKSMLDTTTLAAISAPIAGFLGMTAAYILVRKRFPGKRLLEFLILAPFAIPGTLVGISFVLAFNKAPIVLVGTGAILVVAYVIREMPFGLENGSSTLRQVDPAIEEAAADLGAGPSAVFRTITLPLIRPAFVSTMSFTFVRAMTAVSTIIFLVSPNWYHMTVLVYNYSENVKFGLASVTSVTLIAIVLAAFGVIRLLFKQSVMLEKSGTQEA